MEENESLTTRQRRFVVALLEARSIRGAARLAGVGETTAWRFLATPRVMAEIAARQDALLTGATTGLIADMSEARAVLVALMGDLTQPGAVRRAAAASVLDFGLRCFEVLTLTRRLSELEGRLNDADNEGAVTAGSGAGWPGAA